MSYSGRNIFFHKFNHLTLRSEQFSEEKVDLEKKGYLTIEDFVRFLNLETGSFFRNRDVILIFRRMTKTPEITFTDFLKTICTN